MHGCCSLLEAVMAWKMAPWMTIFLYKQVAFHFHDYFRKLKKNFYIDVVTRNMKNICQRAPEVSCSFFNMRCLDDE